MNVARTRTRTAALGSFGRRTSRYASSHIFPNAERRRTEKKSGLFLSSLGQLVTVQVWMNVVQIWGTGGTSQQCVEE